MLKGVFILPNRSYACSVYLIPLFFMESKILLSARSNCVSSLESLEKEILHQDSKERPKHLNIKRRGIRAQICLRLLANGTEKRFVRLFTIGNLNANFTAALERLVISYEIAWNTLRRKSKWRAYRTHKIQVLSS